MATSTPLARRFAEALRRAEPGRARLSRETYARAFVAAEPSLATVPERRARLAEAIAELAEEGIVIASRAVDRSERPALPRFLLLAERTADPPVGRAAAAFPWRPEFSWAARLPLRRSEFEALRAIQVFVRDRGIAARVVPVGERSLELFDDEKRLDGLLRNRRLFAPGRLSLDLLRARLYPPPFAFRRVGDGPVALVVENVATYHSVLAARPADSPIGLVVFGSGGNFAASVCYLAELMEEGSSPRIRAIRYFGDLDRRGLEIPIAASAAALAGGLPAVRPAVEMWTRLLDVGKRAQHPAVSKGCADQLVAWLPSSARPAARAVLVAGMRVAQEAVGTELLASDGRWATWEGLGRDDAGE